MAEQSHTAAASASAYPARVQGDTRQEQPELDAAPVQQDQLVPVFAIDRRLTEDFAKLVVETFGERTLAAVCLPWSGANGNVPQGVIAPTTEQGTLNMDELGDAFRNKEMIVVACTFKFRAEEAAARTVVQQLENFRADKCIVAAHVLTPGEDHFAESRYQALMNVHQRFHEIGANDVLLDPEWKPARLKVRLKMALHQWHIHQTRLNDALAEGPQPPPREEIDQLGVTQRELLWHDIPRELMPQFKALDPNAQETDEQVGEYVLGSRMETRKGLVRKGTDGQGRPVAVKMASKNDVLTPGEVEGIYREFRFLAGFVKHPNIVQAVACFHGKEHAYTVLRFVNGPNLSQVLDALPGFRMETENACKCFFQLAAAVNHCHSKDVTHRSICLEHVVMKPTSNGGHKAMLIDFQSAMIAKPGVQSVAMCGGLPCMSPEMLNGGPYMPKISDCWNLGVVLLEIVGGKGSLFQALHVDESSVTEMIKTGNHNNRVMLADRILAFFEAAGNHRAALSCMGAVHNKDVEEILEALLQPESRRSTLDNICVDGEGDQDTTQTQTSE